MLMDLDQDIELITERQRTDWNARSRSSSVGTIGRDDDILPSTLDPEEVIDLTIDESNHSYSTVSEGEFALASYRVSGETIKPDDCVQIRKTPLGRYRVHFVVVKAIVRNCMGEVTIRGLPLIRNRSLAAKLPKKINEVCHILHIAQGDPDETPAFINVGVEWIVRKRSLIVTNASWPKYKSGNLHPFTDTEDGRVVDEDNGPLVCRWKFRIISVTQDHRSKPVEEVVERIYASEVTDAMYRVSDEVLCHEWRGGRIPGGSWSPTNPSQPPVGVIELDGPRTSRPQQRQPGQKYTVFDSFAGAGGVSRGAQMAGMVVTHAVDKAEDVWSTYKANFPKTKLFRGSVDEFIRRNRQHIRVDILHLSPPCQYFSPAHTHKGVNDDENIFALFSCNSLINKVRPRIITVEQTFGLTQERHQEYLHILINDFTQFGYSVRWKIVRLCTWGSAQDRKRLIMIAAAPGEKLPPFPQPTHSERGSGGLKPHTTIRKALSRIRAGDSLHNLCAVKWHNPPKPPYIPDRLAGTLTTGGVDLTFPDGSRDLTLREHANLQGFPLYHTFRGTRTSIKKQIGNAFPPNTVKVLYDSLARWLLRQDGINTHQERVADAIMLDEEEETGFMVVDNEIDYPNTATGRPTRRVPGSSATGGAGRTGGHGNVCINPTMPRLVDSSHGRVVVDLT